MLTDYEEILKEIWEENPHLFRSYSEVQKCCNNIITITQSYLAKGQVFQFGSETQFVPNTKTKKKKKVSLNLERNEFIDDIFE